MLSLNAFRDSTHVIISSQLEDEIVRKATCGPIRANLFSMVHRLGVMSVDPWHFVAALYASTDSASTSLVGVPARGTDANRHGSPMAGRVPLDWDTVDDSKWHSVLCILSLPQPSRSRSSVSYEIDLCSYLLLSPIILSQSSRHFVWRALYSNFFSTKQFMSLLILYKLFLTYNININILIYAK